jgi:hypothetical protein
VAKWRKHARWLAARLIQAVDVNATKVQHGQGAGINIAL